ncbi:MAG: sigma-70 family RNA polymerase sigma factor [Candidatus Arcticimaribacter sp.]
MTAPKHESEFVALLEEHQNIVHKICRIYTQSEAEHKDLFQEISIQLWRSFDRFEGKSKFSTWMYRVGLNTAITLYRKNKKRIDTYAINEEINGIELDSYDPVIDEQLNWLYEKIEEFSEIDKALVLLYLENKRYDEIAETLGISTVNARVKMNRIKQRLKKMIKQE